MALVEGTPLLAVRKEPLIADIVIIRALAGSALEEEWMSWKRNPVSILRKGKWKDEQRLKFNDQQQQKGKSSYRCCIKRSSKEFLTSTISTWVACSLRKWTLDMFYFQHSYPKQSHWNLNKQTNKQERPRSSINSYPTIPTSSPSKLMQIKASTSVLLVVKPVPFPREACKTGQSLTAVQLLTQIQTLWTCLSPL